MFGGIRSSSAKGTETYFAFATHACFTSEDFWVHIRQLFMAEIEKLTIFPTIVSACVFCPEFEGTAFVQQINFPAMMQLYNGPSGAEKAYKNVIRKLKQHLRAEPGRWLDIQRTLQKAQSEVMEESSYCTPQRAWIK